MSTTHILQRLTFIYFFGSKSMSVLYSFVFYNLAPRQNKFEQPEVCGLPTSKHRAENYLWDSEVQFKSSLFISSVCCVQETVIQVITRLVVILDVNFIFICLSYG